MYICFIYNPPEYSSYSRKLQDDILKVIEKDISKYSNDGKIILAGDLNARTGIQSIRFYTS
jgi:endonuclease/exonuclease/phosphatase (EEP) superfamily protein YafD